jgi:SH3-like domain-containing protein
MDILNKPGYHVAMFDKWGTKNGVYGAYTYEATTNQYYGGIQGTKRYFMSMNAINSGYIPGRYINVIDGTAQPTATTPVAASSLKSGIFAQTKSTSAAVALKSNASDSSTTVANIPRYTIIYLNKANLGWYQVNYNGKSGWIKGINVTNIQAGAYITTKDVYQLNLRSMPNAVSYINGVMIANKFARVIGYSNDGQWFNIKLLNSTGTQGWVNKKYVNYIY